MIVIEEGKGERKEGRKYCMLYEEKWEKEGRTRWENIVNQTALNH